MDNILFTPAALLDLLAQIEELKHVDVGVSETIDGNIQIQVGDSTYIIEDRDSTEIQVDSTVVDAIDDVNVSAYEDLASSGDVILDNPDNIQSGVLKQIAKTLLVGGLVRLTAKLLK